MLYIVRVCHRGELPAECDKQFLAVACKLDRYGMDFHYITVSWGTHTHTHTLNADIICFRMCPTWI